MARGSGSGDGGVGMEESTQNTQYDEIGTNYMAIKELGAVEAELPSVVAALGRVDGKRCLGMLSFLLLPRDFWLRCLLWRYSQELGTSGGSSDGQFEITWVVRSVV
jgi:hypothetical protein